MEKRNNTREVILNGPVQLKPFIRFIDGEFNFSTMASDRVGTRVSLATYYDFAEILEDDNVPAEEKDFILGLFRGKSKVKLCDAMMWLMQDAWEHYCQNYDIRD